MPSPSQTFSNASAPSPISGASVGSPLIGPGQTQPQHNFVVAGEPEHSKLLYQLRGVETLRMPPDAPLPDPYIALIERWILEGAKDN